MRGLQAVTGLGVSTIIHRYLHTWLQRDSDKGGWIAMTGFQSGIIPELMRPPVYSMIVQLVGYSEITTF